MEIESFSVLILNISSFLHYNSIVPHLDHSFT